MKFSNVLAWASLAFAAPTPAVQERDVAVLNTFVSTIKTLEGTVKTQVDQIVKISKVSNSDEAVITAVKGNFVTIIAAVKESTGTITQIAGSTPADAIKGVQQVDITQVLGAVQSVSGIISQLKTAVEIVVKDLPSSVKSALQDEINSVKGLLWPLLSPVISLVSEVEKLASSLGLKTDALAGVLATVLGLVGGLTDLLNLPNLL